MITIDQKCDKSIHVNGHISYFIIVLFITLVKFIIFNSHHEPGGGMKNNSIVDLCRLTWGQKWYPHADGREWFQNHFTKSLTYLIFY
jgi:hypothetical protein